MHNAPSSINSSDRICLNRAHYCNITVCLVVLSLFRLLLHVCSSTKAEHQSHYEVEAIILIGLVVWSVYLSN